MNKSAVSVSLRIRIIFYFHACTSITVKIVLLRLILVLFAANLFLRKYKLINQTIIEFRLHDILLYIFCQKYFF